MSGDVGVSKLAGYLRIEQPYEIQENGVWFFQTGISGGGAVYGEHIHREKVERILLDKAGPGTLVVVDGVWYWKLDADITVSQPVVGPGGMVGGGPLAEQQERRPIRVDSCSNNQIATDPAATYLVDQEHMLAIVSSGCSRCPGVCCAAFIVDSHLVEKCKRACSGELQRPAEWSEEDTRFIAENFYSLNTDDARVHSCSKFDKNAGRCTAYETRPRLCRTYVCGHAIRGRPPPLTDTLMVAFNAVAEPALGEWKKGSAYRRFLERECTFETP